MLDLINSTTVKALKIFSDSAAQKFYDGLRERRLITTRCIPCRKEFFPPRGFCPDCAGENIDWTELSGRGRLYAFTQQEKSIRFMKPDVIGVVELYGEDGNIIGRIFSRILAPLEALSIGMEVKVSYLEAGKGLVLHQFEPV